MPPTTKQQTPTTKTQTEKEAPPSKVYQVFKDIGHGILKFLEIIFKLIIGLFGIIFTSLKIPVWIVIGVFTSILFTCLSLYLLSLTLNLKDSKDWNNFRDDVLKIVIMKTSPSMEKMLTIPVDKK